MHSRALKVVVGAALVAMISHDVRAQAGADSTADSTRRVRGLRHPATALALGIACPGAGLAYAGYWRQGLATWGGATAGLWVGMAFLVGDCSFQQSGRERTQRCNAPERRAEQALGLGLVGFGAWTWARGAVNAKRAVERDNAAKIGGVRSGVLEPTFTIPTAPGEPWRVGVHATW